MLSETVLAEVQGPARYLGGEVNAVVKDPAAVRIQFALCYPDVYEVGMSHLGSQILYHVINSRPEAACERVYYLQLDAVELMRQRGLTLSGLETGRPLCDFDIVGITLQHELTYTTVLALLELGGVTIRSDQRRPDEPLVLGGGPCTCNPEPVAAFFDAFLIGEGEEAGGNRHIPSAANAPQPTATSSCANSRGFPAYMCPRCTILKNLPRACSLSNLVRRKPQRP